MLLTGGIIIFCMLVTEVSSDTPEKYFKQKQRTHKPKTLQLESMVKLAQLSTQENRQNFERNLLDPMLIERQPGTPGNLLVQQHIENTMSSLGWQIEKDQFEDNTPFGVKNFTNIIATQNPSAARRLTLACHFDSKVFTNFKFIGATDAAVPCAMMLEIALSMNSTIWKDSTSKATDVSLQFIFFDGQEAFVRWTNTDSLYGSRHLAEKFADTLLEVNNTLSVSVLATMDVLILLDLIGHTDVKFVDWFLDTSRWYVRLRKIEQRLARAEMLQPVSSFEGIANKYFTASGAHIGGIQDDHVPFLERGVPVLHLISHPFPNFWHTESDKKSALDFETTNNIITILRVFVAEYLRLSP